jgi:hypothetical protein
MARISCSFVISHVGELMAPIDSQVRTVSSNGLVLSLPRTDKTLAV